MAISEITPLSIRPEVASAANDVDIDDRKEAIITKTATEDSISAAGRLSLEMSYEFRASSILEHIFLFGEHKMLILSFTLPLFLFSYPHSVPLASLLLSASVLCNSRVILSAKGRRRRIPEERRPRAKTDHPDDGGGGGGQLAPKRHRILSPFGSKINGESVNEFNIQQWRL